MSEDELVEYFNEHVVYELLMLRYSKDQLGTIRIVTREDQLQWNAMFAAFNVSARNLYEFLTGKKDNMSVTQYRAHCPTFKHLDTGPIAGIYQKLLSQCLHLGKRRTEAAADKLTLARVMTMHEWLETNIRHLAASFDKSIEIAWKKADWSPRAPLMNAVQQGPTGSGEGLTLRVSLPTHSLTTSSGSGEIFTTGVNTVYPDTKNSLRPGGH